jgi:UDP-glucose 4-epimerase
VNYLVTGGAGFTGSHPKDVLRKNGCEIGLKVA